MGIMVRVINFTLGLIGALLLVAGLTSRDLEKRDEMILVGVGLFALTLIIHFVIQMMGNTEYKKVY